MIGSDRTTRTRENITAAVDVMTRTGAHRITLDGRGIAPSVSPMDAPSIPTTLIAGAVDGHPYPLADGHGSHLHTVPATPGTR